MSLLSDLINLDLTDSTDKIIAEYIWIGGSGTDLRSKARTLPGPVSNPQKLPKWNYDGSSTDQASGEDSEVILYPQAIFKDPFRRGQNILVMCDTYTPTGSPIASNTRYNAAKVFQNPDVVAEEPWFGIEQEYTMLQKDCRWPIGFPAGVSPGPQGPYYCGVGANKVFGREIVEAHYKACLFAGIKHYGVNSEVAPGQWEFQIGPVLGISAGDELWVARYILERIAEAANVVICYDPEPIHKDWNGSGAHTNYSTKSMRSDGGYQLIRKAIEKLGMRHKEHIAVYGEGNERRLTGSNETANYHNFLWGVGNRAASIRVGKDTEKAGKGYFEDRRPASNMDPYLVTAMIAETTLLWKPTMIAEEEVEEIIAVKICNSLPQDIIIEILSWLPAKSLITNSKLVCKAWYTYIHDHVFVKMHLNRGAINGGVSSFSNNNSSLICKSGNELFQLHPPFNFIHGGGGGRSSSSSSYYNSNKTRF